MDINNEKKVDILISALEERYSSIHKIRERVQSTGVWFLGILLAISGFLIQSDIYFSCFEKIIILLGLGATMAAIFYYLNDLEKGFRGQMSTATKLEKALGFYEKKFFSNSEETLYPESWSHAGTKKASGNFFKSTYILLGVGFLFLFVTIIFDLGHSLPYHSQFINYHEGFFFGHVRGY